MGAEISEQDSEKLKKDAFHPGGDTSIEWTAQDAKKVAAVHANWKEFLSKGPDRGSGEWCVKQTWQGQVLQSAPAPGPVLEAFATPLVLPVPPSPPSFSSPPSGLAVGTLASPAHRIGAVPRKDTDLYWMAPGPHGWTRTSTSTGE